jgi:hypothetical protein
VAWALGDQLFEEPAHALGRGCRAGLRLERRGRLVERQPGVVPARHDTSMVAAVAAIFCHRGGSYHPSVWSLAPAVLDE